MTAPTSATNANKPVYNRYVENPSNPLDIIAGLCGEENTPEPKGLTTEQRKVNDAYLAVSQVIALPETGKELTLFKVNAPEGQPTLNVSKAEYNKRSAAYAEKQQNTLEGHLLTHIPTQQKALADTKKLKEVAAAENDWSDRTKKILGIVLIIIGIAVVLLGLTLLSGFVLPLMLGVMGTAAAICTCLGITALGMVSAVFGSKYLKAGYREELFQAKISKIRKEEIEELNKKFDKVTGKCIGSIKNLKFGMKTLESEAAQKGEANRPVVLGSDTFDVEKTKLDIEIILKRHAKMLI